MEDVDQNANNNDLAIGVGILLLIAGVIAAAVVAVGNSKDSSTGNTSKNSIIDTSEVVEPVEIDTRTEQQKCRTSIAYRDDINELEYDCDANGDVYRASGCDDVTSYDYNWNNDMLCYRSDGSSFYTDYAGARRHEAQL